MHWKQREEKSFSYVRPSDPRTRLCHCMSGTNAAPMCDAGYGCRLCRYEFATRCPVLTYANPLPGFKARGGRVRGRWGVCEPAFAQGNPQLCHPVQCPLLSSAACIVLCIRYAMSGTDLSYAAVLGSTSSGLCCYQALQRTLISPTPLRKNYSRACRCSAALRMPYAIASTDLRIPYGIPGTGPQMPFATLLAVELGKIEGVWMATGGCSEGIMQFVGGIRPNILRGCYAMSGTDIRLAS
eukprot:2629351-Rhodomonas_salina.1